MVLTRLGKRKENPPESSKKKKVNSKKKKVTTKEESPTVEFVKTVTVTMENELQNPEKRKEELEKEKGESKKGKEREESQEEEDSEKEKEIEESEKEKEEDFEEESEVGEEKGEEIRDEEHLGQNEKRHEVLGQEERHETEIGQNEERHEVLGQENEDLEVTEAIKPMRMFFYETEYKKQIKIATKCFINDVIETFTKELKPPMTSMERKWFEKHPQFCHLFHMEKDANHMVQGMWMLLLRTVDTSKRCECWFIVNGVPIRYGLREHALISGLNCRNYPLDYKEFGEKKFVKRHFKKGESIRLEDVKAKLLAMGPHKERLKMMVLFFLGSVVCAQTKVSKGAKDVLDFFQRAVDDLDYCERFPWGRYSYDYMLKEISHTMTHFGGKVKEKTLWPLPGFCLPLELLAFETIPKLGLKFREEVEEVDVDCPRMCRSVFKATGMKGFSLSKVNEELDKITAADIHSILPTRTEEEVYMLEDLTEEDDDVDVPDISVDSWVKRLGEGHSVFFEDMYEIDMVARKADAEEVVEAVQREEEAGDRGVGGEKKMMEDLIKQVKGFGTHLKRMKKTVDKFGERLAPLEAFVEKAKKKGWGGKKKGEKVASSPSTST